MLYAGGLLGAVLVLLWLFCIIDVIMTPEGECRYLPKLLWLGIVVLLSTVGSLVWLLAGRPWPNGSPLERLAGGRAGGPGRSGAYERATPAYPEYDRPGRFAATSPDDDDAFLAQVRARAEAQRRAHAEQRRERDHADRAARERRQQARRERHDDSGDGGDLPGGHDRDGEAG